MHCLRFSAVPSSVSTVLVLLAGLLFLLPCSAETPAPHSGSSPKKPAAPPDTLDFVNGDHLSGQFLRAIGSDVYFHSEVAGDVTVKWDQIRQLKTSTRLVVFRKSIFHAFGNVPQDVPRGTLIVEKGEITAFSDSGVASAPVPVKSAEYIVDENILKKQITGHPGFLGAWNGSLTGGAAIVQASQDQYTFSGAVSLTRTVPTVAWLNTHNRTSVDFSGSFGKIIQPAYSNDGVYTPSSASKSSIYHADAERDEYFSPRFYVLSQTSFDHNFAQALDLQQIYGAGIGWTAVKRNRQLLDLKTTLQYEGQSFLQASAGQNQNLIGSTLNATWSAKLPHNVQFKQQVYWIPAFNNTYAYSASETDGITMPFFKNLAFSVGSMDSYLNDPPPAVPPTKRNSFQFTTGLTYAIKSKY